MALHELNMEAGWPLVGCLRLVSTGTNRQSMFLTGLIDTGSTRTIMGCGVEEHLELRIPDDIDTTNGFNEGVQTRLYYNIDVVFPQGDQFRITVGCTGQNLFRTHGIHVIIGMDIISRGILTIDNVAGRFSLEFRANQ